MGYFSILPERLGYIEQGVSYVFVLLGLITIGPWLLLFSYDLILYTWRSLTHDMPLVGGAAHGKRRPRAPSLVARPDGRRRRFSLAALSVDLKQHAIQEKHDDNHEQQRRHDSLVDSGCIPDSRRRQNFMKKESEDEVMVED